MIKSALSELVRKIESRELKDSHIPHFIMEALKSQSGENSTKTIFGRYLEKTVDFTVCRISWVGFFFNYPKSIFGEDRVKLHRNGVAVNFKDQGLVDSTYSYAISNRSSSEFKSFYVPSVLQRLISKTPAHYLIKKPWIICHPTLNLDSSRGDVDQINFGRGFVSFHTDLKNNYILISEYNYSDDGSVSRGSEFRLHELLNRSMEETFIKYKNFCDLVFPSEDNNFNKPECEYYVRIPFSWKMHNAYTAEAHVALVEFGSLDSEVFDKLYYSLYVFISLINNKVAYSLGVEKGKKDELFSYIESKVSDFNRFIGNSDYIKKVETKVRLTASSDLNVVVSGESGTGKSFIARKLHELSNRSHKSLLVCDGDYFNSIKASFKVSSFSKRRVERKWFDFVCDGSIYLEHIKESLLCTNWN